MYLDITTLIYYPQGRIQGYSSYANDEVVFPSYEMSAG